MKNQEGFNWNEFISKGNAEMENKCDDNPRTEDAESIKQIKSLYGSIVVLVLILAAALILHASIITWASQKEAFHTRQKREAEITDSTCCTPCLQEQKDERLIFSNRLVLYHDFNKLFNELLNGFDNFVDNIEVKLLDNAVYKRKMESRVFGQTEWTWKGMNVIWKPNEGFDVLWGRWE